MKPGSGRRVADFEDDGGRALQVRLLRGDPTAPSELLTAYLSPLVARLGRDFARVDETVLHDVATDLLLNLGMQPRQYDPARSSLSTYVRMAARRDVLNVLEREQRRARRIAALDDVELHREVRNSEWTRTSDPADMVMEALEQEKVLAMREEFDERDWELVLLQMDGERRTEPFAVILGLQDQPLEVQVREVKRAKDRLKKRLQRLWRRMYGDG